MYNDYLMLVSVHFLVFLSLKRAFLGNRSFEFNGMVTDMDKKRGINILFFISLISTEGTMPFKTSPRAPQKLSMQYFSDIAYTMSFSDVWYVILLTL